MFAARRIEHVKKLLAKLKIDPARLEMYNLSAAMGPRWAEICTQFTEKIRRLGPSPIGVALAKRKVKE
jgi:F420-non-reducing hydrogenase iron-sulfur subunit